MPSAREPIPNGTRFGHWTVLEYLGRDGAKQIYRASCSCGTVSKVQGGNLKSGASRSCGCVKRATPVVGTTFGALTVMESFRQSGKTYVRCSCACGGTWEGLYSRVSSGNTKSCGCRKPAKVVPCAVFGEWTVLERDPTKKKHFLCRCSCGTVRSRIVSHITSGESVSCGCKKSEQITAKKTKHGYSHSAPGGNPVAEYRAWTAMKNRCRDMRHKDYAGRGISVYPEWAESFEAFLRDVGPRPSPQHSLDRIDVDGNYEPGNVRWTTWDVQNNNRRSVRQVSHNDEVHSVSEWCRLLHIKPGRVWYAISKGLTPYEAIFISHGCGRNPGDVTVESMVPPPAPTDTCADSAHP